MTLTAVRTKYSGMVVIVHFEVLCNMPAGTLGAIFLFVIHCTSNLGRLLKDVAEGLHAFNHVGASTCFVVEYFWKSGPDSVSRLPTNFSLLIAWISNT